ncbi:stage 0 sporulation protein B (sporulation initiation phosphotransferase) [Planococcus glaciei]|uniref:Spo0B domain-containing protein n=1 Tax=Planococcus glaciei TaxID=459472 RepID=UPI0008894942|nr:Spo0B domain-containing protein [Planococcus glaciei]SDI20367.1 stage 0 sporulation protein B (sporulation initiation phosphotransferase) [Planococcus glaciei]
MKETKTVAQSLRHARHDFLNELQLINMYLDLGRQEEAQAIIRSHAEAAVHLSRLSGLKMPMTEEWLLLSKWQHPEFHFRVECLAAKGITEKDAAFLAVLEQFVHTVEPKLDPYAEYAGLILLKNEGESLTMELALNGNWTDLEIPEVSNLHAVKECGPDGLRVTVRAQMEG